MAGTKENSKGKNQHSGHRKRMRDKFSQMSPSCFEDHEIVEMLLYYVFTRHNTNEMAHELLDRFGSIKGLLDATSEELMDVPMIGEKAAMLVQLVSELLRRYYTGIDKREHFSSIDKIGRFFAYKFAGIGVESVCALLLDNSLGFIDCKMVYQGSVNSAKFDLDKLYQYAFSKKAANVIVAHNHPRGLTIPSEDDKAITRILAQGFGHLGINLAEHIIVSGERFLPIMRNSEDAFLRKMSEDRLDFEKVEYMTGRID